MFKVVQNAFKLIPPKSPSREHLFSQERKRLADVILSEGVTVIWEPRAKLNRLGLKISIYLNSTAPFDSNSIENLLKTQDFGKDMQNLKEFGRELPQNGKAPSQSIFGWMIHNHKQQISSDKDKPIVSQQDKIISFSNSTYFSLLEKLAFHMAKVELIGPNPSQMVSSPDFATTEISLLLHLLTDTKNGRTLALMDGYLFAPCSAHHELNIDLTFLALPLDSPYRSFARLGKIDLIRGKLT